MEKLLKDLESIGMTTKVEGEGHGRYLRTALPILFAFTLYDLSKIDTQIILYIMAFSYSYGKKFAVINTPELIKLIGKERAHVYKRMKDLIDRNVITTVEVAGKKVYGINKRVEEWKYNSRPDQVNIFETIKTLDANNKADWSNNRKDKRKESQKEETKRKTEGEQQNIFDQMLKEINPEPYGCDYCEGDDLGF